MAFNFTEAFCYFKTVSHTCKTPSYLLVCVIEIIFASSCVFHIALMMKIHFTSESSYYLQSVWTIMGTAMCST